MKKIAWFFVAWASAMMFCLSMWFFAGFGPTATGFWGMMASMLTFIPLAALCMMKGCGEL